MSRRIRVVLVAAIALLPMVALAQSQAPLDELNAAVRAARDADLKADWDGLLDARARVAALESANQPPGLVAYYLGYIDWRTSSLAFLVSGQQGMAALLARAVDHLRASVAATPTFAEAQALLATCAGILAGTTPSRLEELSPVMKAAWPPALEHGGGNPRVQLLRAMTEVFAPPQYGGNRERGLERWSEAIRLFEREQKHASDKGGGERWGHAEAWAWLGGAYLTMGRHKDAQAALEEAVKLRPDFWWAAKAALPQARRPK